jgi:FtsP/CotA-like multicopper oxidase with cupredoxin domain
MKHSTTIRAAVLAALAGLAASAAEAATINQTVCVGQLNKTMSDGATVTFWGFTTSCNGMGGQVPGPQVEVGVGDTLNLTLNMMMAPQEPAPYNGHTVHLHGADVKQSEDGVPETGAAVTGDTYTFSPTSRFAGSLIYHCHVHTVKHLEMGMYGPLVVRPKDAAGNFLNQITASSASAYDYVQTYLFSSVDPAYHTATGDSTVFADYNPKYFLIAGNEGKSTSAPALTLAAAVSKKVALRLIGLHSVNASFSLGGQSFTIYARDGIPLATPQTATGLDLAPGQRADIVFTTPSTSGALYPRITYKSLRTNSTLSTAYGKVTF